MSIPVSDESQTESCSCENNNNNNNNIPIFDSKVREEFSLNGSSTNSKYAKVVTTIYQIFNTLCQNHDVCVYTVPSMKLNGPFPIDHFLNYSRIETIKVDSRMSPHSGQISGSKNVYSTKKLKLPSAIN